MLKIIKVVKNIIFWIATVLLVLSLALVALEKFGQINLRTIVSGSMEPEISVGSLIIIVPTDPEKLMVGDVVTFAISESDTVTHKIIENSSEKKTLITHGIANSEGVNEITPYKNVIGKVVFSIPFIGNLFLFISTTSGKVIAAISIVFLYVLSVFIKVLLQKTDDENNHEQQNIS